jgi:hypothetical protein
MFAVIGKSQSLHLAGLQELWMAKTRKDALVALMASIET